MTVYCVQEDEGTLRSFCMSDAFVKDLLVCCHPLFTSFNDVRMASTNVLAFADAELRAKMLGDAIPAESFAAGRNPTDGVSENYNMQSELPNGWPRSGNDWQHSDIKNVSYYYVYKLFEKLLK